MNAVEVINLTKIYRSNLTLFNVFRPQKHNINDKIALKNINFCVGRGESFGIIGRNGAGKSTLLQLLVGTLSCTTGQIHINGRVSALLELGSGFNPEFTGIENIYLAGSILGISRLEMTAKIEEILDFADIGSYVNLPVRTYSTGMLMRIAFAVAIAVEPQILIIDEALSVGDILFQQKCNARMRLLKDLGVTIIAVTHDTSFIVNMCERAMWIDNGLCKFIGSSGDCVKEYIAAMTSQTHCHRDELPLTKASSRDIIKLPSVTCVNINTNKRLGDRGIYINNLWITNLRGENCLRYLIGEIAEIILEIRTKEIKYLCSAGCEIRDRLGQVIFATGLHVVNRLIDSISNEQKLLLRIKIKLDICPGRYSLDVGCGSGKGDTNSWEKVLNVAVLEVYTNETQEVVHGIAKLPYELEEYIV